MALKDKATKKTNSATGQKAKSRGLGKPTQKDPEQAVAERTTLPTVTNQPPTPPPPNLYLSFFASIPSLRKQNGGQ